MKKFLVIFIILTLLLSSCQKREMRIHDIANKVASNNAIPYPRHYVCGAAEYSDKYLHGSISQILYGCDILGYCSDFSVTLSKKDVVSELHILLAKSEEKADSLKKCLKSRADVLRNKEIYLYDPENADKINAMVYQKGLYVCLVAGENSEIMYEKLCKILK